MTDLGEKLLQCSIDLNHRMIDLMDLRVDFERACARRDWEWLHEHGFISDDDLALVKEQG